MVTSTHWMILKHLIFLFLPRQIWTFGIEKSIKCSDGSGLKIFDSCQVGSGQFFNIWVGLGLENFHPKPPIFQFFPFESKKISLVWVKKYPGQGQVGLLFTAGQKYARVRSGQGPFLNSNGFILKLFYIDSPWDVLLEHLGIKDTLCEAGEFLIVSVTTRGQML